jgi:hypothetical protein
MIGRGFVIERERRKPPRGDRRYDSARKGRHRGETNIGPASPARSFSLLLLAAFTEPRQAPTRAFTAFGVHRPLEIADVGVDGDTCRRGMHFLDLRVRVLPCDDSVQISFI